MFPGPSPLRPIDPPAMRQVAGGIVRMVQLLKTALALGCLAVAHMVAAADGTEGGAWGLVGRWEPAGKGVGREGRGCFVLVRGR